MNSIDEKVRKFEQQIVFFQNYREAYTKLELAVESTNLRGIPTSAIIIGPSGAGKSRLCEVFRDSFPAPHKESYTDGIRTIIPALLCCVPPIVTLKSFCKTLLESLGCDDVRGDTVDLELRFVRLLITCQTLVIIIDEFQRLTKPGNEKQLIATIDWLLGILNRIKIPIIIAGTEECQNIVYKQIQLARRYPYCVELRYLEFNQDYDSEYISTLRGLDEKLYEIGDLKKGVHLTDPSIYTRLYVASQGNLEYIRLILSAAFKYCLNRKSNTLELSDFHAACQPMRLLLSLSKKNNPFNIDISTCYSLIEQNAP